MDVSSIFEIAHESLDGSGYSWIIEASLVTVVFAVTVLVVASVLYSSPVQKLIHDLRRLGYKLFNVAGEASKGPYDVKFEDSPIGSWFVIAFFYSFSVLIFIYALLFLMIFTGALGPEDLPFYKKLIALGFGLVVVYVARLQKVQADRLLHKKRRQ